MSQNDTTGCADEVKILVSLCCECVVGVGVVVGGGGVVVIIVQSFIIARKT